jgi:hypothetical protein
MSWSIARSWIKAGDALGCCGARSMSGAGQKPLPSLVSGGDRCSPVTGRHRRRPSSFQLRATSRPINNVGDCGSFCRKQPMAGRFRTLARCDTLELAKTSSQMSLERQPVPPCVELPRTWKWKESMALRKKIAAKPQAWNKGLEVGKKDAFTPAQVKRIRGVLADRGVSGLRDLTFFSMAIDTMLRGADLVALTVRDVQLPNGTIRSVIKIAPTRRRPPVQCAVSEKTARTLGKWIANLALRVRIIFSRASAAGTLFRCLSGKWPVC